MKTLLVHPAIKIKNSDEEQLVINEPQSNDNNPRPSGDSYDDEISPDETGVEEGGLDEEEFGEEAIEEEELQDPFIEEEGDDETNDDVETVDPAHIKAT